MTATIQKIEDKKWVVRIKNGDTTIVFESTRKRRAKKKAREFGFGGIFQKVR